MPPQHSQRVVHDAFVVDARGVDCVVSNEVDLLAILISRIGTVP